MENQYELKDGFLRVRIPKELDHHSAIGRCKNMNYSGGSVEAEHLNARIEKIFLVSGLNKIIKVHKN